METTNIIPFVKDVSKYFMDFLETDFHKRKNPKRSIQIRNSSNLLVGLALNKYPSFNALVWKSVAHKFDRNLLNTIRKGVYRTVIPLNLLALIKLQLEKISANQVKKTIEALSEEIENFSVLHKEEYDAALDNSLEAAARTLKNDLVLPFINSIAKSIENLKLGDDNNLYLMEEELTVVLVSLLENKISEILRRLIADDKVQIKKELLLTFELENVKSSIFIFFENFQIGDLFAEFYEMDRNKAILDKQEFYLYFCDISFNGAKYPIFYIPVSNERQADSISLEFDSQVYINKKALEYISQEYNTERDKHGSLKEITERIIYLSQYDNNFLEKIQTIVDELTNFFNLDKTISLSDPTSQISRSELVKVTNSCYFSLFDKSDEALVNDYEEILELLDAKDNKLAEAFHKLINDFIHKNPEPFNPTVENEWDNAEVTDKLIFKSPVPLNSEQLQILSAIQKKDCKYIIIEGPPGTGKSHTITAIIFDAILKSQSVLVLSDKKEALDVVEDKITDTMNKVRYDKNFQNPILRLGKTGNTYNQILATSTIENIKTHYKVVKKEHETLESNVEKLSNSIQEDLEAEIIASEEVSLNDIKELVDLESHSLNTLKRLNKEELLSNKDSTLHFDEIRSCLSEVKGTLFLEDGKTKPLFLRTICVDLSRVSKMSSFCDYVNLGKSLVFYFQEIKSVHGSDLDLLAVFEALSEKSAKGLSEYVKRYEESKQWVFGYLFKKKQVEELDRIFRNEFALPKDFIGHQKLADLKKTLLIIDSINEHKSRNSKDIPKSLDLVNFVHQCLVNKDIITSIEQLVKIGSQLDSVKKYVDLYPNTFNKLGIDASSFKALITNDLLTISDLDFDKLIRYIYLSQKLEKDFASLPEGSYTQQMNSLHELVTTQMTYHLDGRLIDFYENNKNTATHLRNIIRSKRRFPKDEFIKLKQAFPCILAGIRDYAEFIPLEPEMFDLLIIDEASQVSIAQAFPALLRAKKILILGDKKQFSNVKSAQARSDTNREYLNTIMVSFKKHISREESELIKLQKFNIKTSILEFFEFISNYRTQLLKHFRGYKEIISYSNKHFYQDNLQVMKIRGKRIDEVLKFSIIKHDGKEEAVYNTNALEVDFIIKELAVLKEKNSSQTVGIITPHTNQQKLLVEKINKLAEKDYYFDKLKLKIMTFDTCQGEERDIIFYSMVATKTADHLWGVFIKNLAEVDIEEDGKIKAQRLNVGFSRAKECMHFILSKSIEDYSGSVGEAIRHYYHTHQESKKEHGVEETDKNSKMEPAVLNWFYQTEFWKNNREKIELFPQFELGKYLKQLDRLYSHPNYKVDFFITYIDEKSYEHKIIIEYDGFMEHFKDQEGINGHNYQEYYSEEDLYRQKILESYGYKFIRVNKFNIGKNPILTLNSRIEKLVKLKKINNGLLETIRVTIDSLNNGLMRECPKCKELRGSEDFKDSNLITGYGRFCKVCKSSAAASVGSQAELLATISTLQCPRCSSKMVLRAGKFGKFYGCSKFPYCRGTRQYE